jgi:hypothetical protein
MQWPRPRKSQGWNGFFSRGVIPLAGLYGILRDPEHLTWVSGAIFLSMTGVIPLASLVDLRRRLAEALADEDDASKK